MGNMSDILKTTVHSGNIPQCQFFVVRKKRLCRMTVRPGRQYCREHEPQPRTEESQDDTRIPCPNDPKHTCYASKLEKHLSICNARRGETPPYIVYNINAPTDVDECVRKPLSEIPRDVLMQVIDKVNLLYEKYIEGNIGEVPEFEVHPVVAAELSAADRTERSRRHLRQASTLLRLVEDTGLVAHGTCYVELGAGKGQLSYYMGRAWCGGDGGGGGGSRVVAVDRAAMRHKRDNKLRAGCRPAHPPARTLEDGTVLEQPLGDDGAEPPEPPASRVRADLAHLALQHVPDVRRCSALVGVAKHLCGVAMDYALRSLTAEGALERTRGCVLATCCHHRCERGAYVGREHLQELGISGEEFNIILGIVSWATCGDGRSRERRRLDGDVTTHTQPPATGGRRGDDGTGGEDGHNVCDKEGEPGVGGVAWRAQTGRRAKALVDWGRVLHLRRRGLRAGLRAYCGPAVSPENLAILAARD